MKIGIVGEGVVGSAIHRGFKELGHTVFVHDKKYSTSLFDLKNTEIIFVCVPTPVGRDNSCDTSAVKTVVNDLMNIGYSGIVAIKSTIIPGTLNTLNFDKSRLCHVPEFLREATAYEDFVYRHNVLIIGSPNQKVTDTVISAHGSLPKETLILTPEESEFVKYFSNVFKAYKTVFANSFGKLCSEFNVDYKKILRAYELEGVKETDYLKFIGPYGGMCLPKDVLALQKLTEILLPEVSTFNFIHKENEKLLSSK